MGDQQWSDEALVGPVHVEKATALHTERTGQSPPHWVAGMGHCRTDLRAAEPLVGVGSIVVGTNLSVGAECIATSGWGSWH